MQPAQLHVDAVAAWFHFLDKLGGDAREREPEAASFLQRAEAELGAIEVEIEWGDKRTVRRDLSSEDVRPQVRYLSQRFVERLTQRNLTPREICRKSSTKDRWKENERWAYPFLSGLKDKKLLVTTAAGNYVVPPSEKELEAERKRKEGR